MTFLSIMYIRHRESLSAAYPKRLKFVFETVKIIYILIKLRTKKLCIINSLHKFYCPDDVQEDKIELRTLN